MFGQLEHTTSGLSLSPHTLAWLWLVVHTDQSECRGAREGWLPPRGLLSPNPFRNWMHSLVLCFPPSSGGWDVEVTTGRDEGALADPGLAHDPRFSPAWASAALLPAAAHWPHCPCRAFSRVPYCAHVYLRKGSYASVLWDFTFPSNGVRTQVKSILLRFFIVYLDYPVLQNQKQEWGIGWRFRKEPWKFLKSTVDAWTTQVWTMPVQLHADIFQ